MFITPTVTGSNHAPVSMAVRSSFIRHEPADAAGPRPDCLLRLHALTTQRRRVACGAELYRQGDNFTALYEIHAGAFKTCLTERSSRHRVVGFHMTGDLLGLDGVAAERHSVAAVALEDALVSVIPYDALNHLLREFASLQHEFHKVLSREIVRNHAVMLLLGSVAAEGRVAAFLLDLIGRLRARGYSSSAFVLRLSRTEIGSYLGLQLETVSRTFSKLQSDGVLAISRRSVCVLHEAALHRILQGPGGGNCCNCRATDMHCRMC